MRLERLERTMHQHWAARKPYERVNAGRRSLWYFPMRTTQPRSSFVEICNRDRIEFPTASRARVRGLRHARAAVENSCSAVHHLSNPEFCPINRGHLCPTGETQLKPTNSTSLPRSLHLSTKLDAG